MIFDVDGVLLDSMGIWDDLGIRYLKKLNIEPEPNLSEILYPLSLEQGAQYLKENYSLKDEKEIIQDLLNLLRDYYYYEVPLKEGVKEYLESISNVPKIICTSSDRDLVEKALKRNGILKYFDKILTCSEEQVGKDQPDIFLKAASLLHKNPNEIIVFEDSYGPIKIAKEVGFKVYALEEKASLKDIEKIKTTCNQYYKSFKDLL